MIGCCHCFSYKHYILLTTIVRKRTWRKKHQRIHKENVNINFALRYYQKECYCLSHQALIFPCLANEGTERVLLLMSIKFPTISLRVSFPKLHADLLLQWQVCWRLKQ